MDDLKLLKTEHFLIGGTACGVSVFVITLFLLRNAPFITSLPVALAGFGLGFVCSIGGVALGKWWLARGRQKKNERNAEPSAAPLPRAPQPGHSEGER